MTGSREQAGHVDALYAGLLRGGTLRAQLREILAGIDETVLLALLRRAVPVEFLNEVAQTRPWSERPHVLARLILSPRAPGTLSLRLIDAVYWRDLAEVAATMRVNGAVRARAEALLREGLHDMRLGDRISLARVATPALLVLLLADAERKVVDAALDSPRLREEDLVTALGRLATRSPLAVAASESARWARSYSLKLALVLQPRTPLPIALHQIRQLVPRDLRRVAGQAELHPLLRSLALAALEEDPV